jgi:hypothetical protein
MDDHNSTTFKMKLTVKVARNTCLKLFLYHDQLGHDRKYLI